MRSCCCSLAGTMACDYCPNAPRPLPQPMMWTYAYPAPEVDYEKLADMIAERLKREATDAG